MHRTSSHQGEHYDYTNESRLPPAAPSFSNLELLEDNATTELGADYTLPLSKARSLKLGYSWERDDYRFGNAGNNLDPVTGVQTVDPNVTNDFQFRQQINSTYASWQDGIGAWNLLAGLRAELTHTQAQQRTDAISTSGSYFQAYPSLHVDRTLSDEETLSFGASRRITRPDPSNLNPYVDHEYTPNLRAGNVGLQPQYTQSVEAGYGFEGRSLAWQLTAYFRRNRDSVTDVTQYLGNGFSLTTKTNLPRNDATGLEFTANGHIVAMLAYSVSGNLFHSQIDATAMGLPGLRSSNGVNAKLKFDLRPSALHSGQLVITRSDKRLTPQGSVSAINFVNIGYRGQLRRNLALVSTVSDIFNGQRYERFETTPSFTGDYLRSVRGRVCYVGLQYSFGARKSDRHSNFEYDHGD